MYSNIEVAVRCRPLNERENDSSSRGTIECDDISKTVSVIQNRQRRSYHYDKVFGVDATQEDVFNGVAYDLIKDVLNGFNCTIFAYGQTGTGKTFTMEGIPSDSTYRGIIPRSIEMILTNLLKSGSQYEIVVSFLEIYKEELRDLLSPSNHLKIIDDSQKGVICQNLEEVCVNSLDEIMKLFNRANENRMTATTLLNEKSSRSHSIFTITLNIKEQPEGSEEEIIKTGKLNLVDLAGSENAMKAGVNNNNDRLRESQKINQSLLTLGRVITSLVENKSHIPYRDSNLTRLLKESLGGRAKTCLIATITGDSGVIDESINTLEYALKAKNIKNRPVINQKKTNKAKIRDYTKRINELQILLKQQRDNNGILIKEEEYKELNEKLNKYEENKRKYEKVINEKRNEINEKENMKNELYNIRQNIDNHINSHQMKRNEYFNVIENLENEKELRSSEREKLEYKLNKNLEIFVENSNENEKFQNEMKNKMNEIRSFLSNFNENEENKYSLIFNEIESFCSSCSNEISSINEDLSVLCSEISRINNNTKDNVIKSTNNIKMALSEINSNLMNLNQSIDEYKSVVDADNSFSENNEKWFKEDSDEIINSIYKLKEYFDEKLSDYVKQLQNMENKQESKLFALMDIINEGMNDLMNEEDSFWPGLEEMSENIINNNNIKVKNNAENIMNKIVSIKNNSMNYKNSFDVRNEKEKEIISKYMNNIKNEFENTKSCYEDIVNINDQYINSIENSKTISNDINRINESIDNLNRWTILDQYNEIPNEFEEFSNSLNEKCNDLISELSDFMRSYKIIVPTGITPQKRQFILPELSSPCKNCPSFEMELD